MAETDLGVRLPDDTPKADSTAPPPYSADAHLPYNPGFCAQGHLERLANQRPKEGMPSSQYYKACKGCGLVCGDYIPASYKAAWPQWVDPSVNFRWESHIAATPTEHRELLGCWICWEYEQTWAKPMLQDEWYAHMRRHFLVDGYRVCKGRTGAMQRRRNCEVVRCPKIHS